MKYPFGTQPPLAAVFLRVALQQRPTTEHSDLVRYLLEGARTDWAAVQAKGNLSEPPAQVFEQVIGMLEPIDAQSRQAGAGTGGAG